MNSRTQEGIQVNMHLRISKYNPEHRDKNGSYLKDDWTSVTDIGKSYADGILTVEKYLKTEDAYWNTVKKLLVSCHISNMKITELEKNVNYLQDIPIELQEASKNIMSKMEDQDLFSVDSLEDVFKMVLRELFWCKMIGEDGSYLHFGYDYYVYFGSNRLSEKVISASDPMIYIESFESPYL